MKSTANHNRRVPTRSAAATSPIRFVPWGLLCGVGFAAVVFLPSPLRADDTNDVKQEETVKKKVFAFDGGNPLEFIVALDRHFRTRLVQVLTLPEVLSKTKVPKLRVAADDPREVLSVYNRLQSPTLGQWHYEPDGTTPKPPGIHTNTNVNMNALMLVPDKTVVASKMDRSVMRVKGLALAGVPETKWEGLLHDIKDAQAYGEKAVPNGGAAPLEGSIRVQRESMILLAAGTEAYIEMVESLVSAHRINAELEMKSAAAAKAASTREEGK